MRDYSKVSPSLWHSERFNSLPSDDGRYLYLYLLTNEHQTMAGCYRLPDGYACSDLQWPNNRYRKALDQLVVADLIAFDTTSSVIGITRWFKHNPPMTEKHLIGIVRLLERLPSETIGETAAKAAVEALQSFAAQKAAKGAESLKAATGAPNGLAGGLPSHLETPYMNRKP